ncbi:MAG: hypothetical protein M5R38_18305 [Candidatus Methylomirabilis sp.]|nr:hypothetical protein [Candidatus Methylomirabilis sp.]
MKKRHLLAPGPTPVFPDALLAMARPILYHRGPEYEVLLGRVREGLRYLFQTKNEVLLFTSSGTGGMEGAVINTLSPGDRALVIRSGKFGERWGRSARPTACSRSISMWSGGGRSSPTR